MIGDRIIPEADELDPGWRPVGRELVFAAKEIRTAFAEALTRAGGSLATWVVLNALAGDGPVSQKMLASHVHIDGATMTHHIDRLEERGLVRRRVSPGDRRVRHVEATPAGKRLHRRLLREAQAFEQAVVAGLTDGELAELRRLLAHIASNIALLEG